MPAAHASNSPGSAEALVRGRPGPERAPRGEEFAEGDYCEHRRRAPRCAAEEVRGTPANRGTDREHDRAELRRAVNARELLYALFFARVRGGRFSHADLQRFVTLASKAYRAASLEPTVDGRVKWRWSRFELATVRHVAVTAAVELLGNEPSGRLKQCPGEHCGWFFLDATKRGNRRWCSMSECGQDAKSVRRRARLRPI